ncbi:MAG: YueI family protein [Lactobacillus sp.]|uniref:DUF1694 domain-containing protein n=1 Tax=Bombilactobacillus bombi TaxID=1303590 RepID=A0A3R6ZZE9_9LACO|nr:YueI family protein [Bombilactobacillus bombi]MCO6540784.1 YueI family protein [Lactobacillus sp.]MCO6542430.1 YueI family protein [Lactobacillus sp.]RHW48645.1 DUF1694 domain-containing protein [Bombilactobacillus bombi]RHW52130.1 DUF1694 domain-containing protein [Bombilactobacillus bombi]
MTDIEEYLKQNVFGKPQLKPDEKRKFLGNFQERVALALTVAQVRNLNNLVVVERVIKQYPQYHLFINGRLSSTYRVQLMTLAVNNNYQFTIIEQAHMRSDTKPLAENDMGLVIADDRHSIDRPVLI